MQAVGMNAMHTPLPCTHQRVLYLAGAEWQHNFCMNKVAAPCRLWPHLIPGLGGHLPVWTAHTLYLGWVSPASVDCSHPCLPQAKNNCLGLYHVQVWGIPTKPGHSMLIANFPNRVSSCTIAASREEHVRSGTNSPSLLERSWKEGLECSGNWVIHVDCSVSAEEAE
jgi:hypothetical protein